MEARPRQPTTKGPAETFTGNAWLDVIVRGESPRSFGRGVHFAPGARNAWHAHAIGQTVHVTEGIGRMRTRGGTAQIRGGDGLHATRRMALARCRSRSFMTHVANGSTEVGPSHWAEQVSEEDYLGS